jgi:methylenetetrahydrofolate dehydrogenase (NADP+)/methenyltetrahydrofolate cyclohydrolase
MLLNHGATVTTCHSKTKDLKFHTSKADILVVATGQRHMIKADMVKPGAVVIDVGFSKVEDDIYGDVDFLNVAPITSYITPVPGGVGPMTVACLMENLMIAYQNQTS